MTIITELFIYPIKGARPVAVSSVEVDAGGFRGDREFAVFSDGKRCNVKQIPGIMFLAARPADDGLLLSFPGQASFLMKKSLMESVQPGSAGSEAFRGGETPTVDMGDEVAAWLSQALGRTVRLCRIAEPTPFIIPLPEFTDVHLQPQDRFVDAAPVMLANTASFLELNQRLAQPVEMGRFRPNIVLNGLAPWREDQQHTFEFEQVIFKQVAPCERCAVVTMDLDTGKTGKEPLATLANFRRRDNDYAGGVMFGSYLAVSQPGILNTGDVLLNA